MTQATTTTQGDAPQTTRIPPMPGDAIAHRPLHFLWLIDASGSMQGAKIESLNTAINEVLPTVKKEADEWPEVQMKMGAITFANGAKWHTKDFQPLEQFTWTGVRADGVTDMGHAFELVADFLRDNMPDRAIPPVLVLMSDGGPTDDYRSGIKRILDLPWGKKAVRLAIAIGQDADTDVLKAFVANNERPVIQANSPEKLVDAIRWASTTVTKSVAAGRSKSGSADDPEVPLPPKDASGVKAEDVW